MWESHKGYFVGHVEVGTLVDCLVETHDMIGYEKKLIMQPSIRYMMTRRRLGHRKQHR